MPDAVHVRLATTVQKVPPPVLLVLPVPSVPPVRRCVSLVQRAHLPAPKLALPAKPVLQDSTKPKRDSPAVSNARLVPTPLRAPTRLQPIHARLARAASSMMCSARPFARLALLVHTLRA